MTGDSENRSPVHLCLTTDKFVLTLTHKTKLSILLSANHLLSSILIINNVSLSLHFDKGA